jgi:hypothetical protein
MALLNVISQILNCSTTCTSYIMLYFVPLNILNSLQPFPYILQVYTVAFCVMIPYTLVGDIFLQNVGIHLQECMTLYVTVKILNDHSECQEMYTSEHHIISQETQVSV